jgi:hypothetical protein
VTRILAVLLFAIPALSRAGAESVGTTSANFLKIPPHARAAAMGEAFTALSDDENALIYNPAGSAQMIQNEISATHIEWFQGIHLEHLGAIFTLGPLGTLGGAITWLQTDSLTRTERVANTSDPLANYKELGTFSPHDAAFNFSYATLLGPSLKAGANLRLLQQNIDSNNGYGVSIDLGGQWENLFKGFDVGLVAHNIGTPISVGSTGYQLPLALTGGILYRFSNWPASLTGDYDAPIDNVGTWGLGAEFWLYNMLALRAGYRGGWANQPSAGAGFKLEGLSLDYAWVPFNELGPTHRVTASYSFGMPSLGLELEKPLIGPI